MSQKIKIVIRPLDKSKKTKKVVIRELTPMEKHVRNAKREITCCRDNVVKHGKLSDTGYQLYICNVCGKKLYEVYEPTEDQVKKKILDRYTREMNDLIKKIETLEWLKKSCNASGIECQYNDDTSTCNVCGRPETSLDYWWY